MGDFCEVLIVQPNSERSGLLLDYFGQAVPGTARSLNYALSSILSSFPLAMSHIAFGIRRCLCLTGGAP